MHCYFIYDILHDDNGSLMMERERQEWPERQDGETSGSLLQIICNFQIALHMEILVSYILFNVFCIQSDTNYFI